MKKSSRLSLFAAAAAAALVASALPALAHPTHDGTGKETGFDQAAEDVSPGGVPQERMSDVRCEDGMAGIFPCQQVDLASFIPLKEMNSIWANDVWGWTDPVTGREYALAKLYEGTAFVDITDASNPTYLGTLPSPAPDPDNPFSAEWMMTLPLSIVGMCWSFIGYGAVTVAAESLSDYESGSLPCLGESSTASCLPAPARLRRRRIRAGAVRKSGRRR